MQLIHSLKSRRDEEEGFTLIELMVVVLIIAILIAIAIPTFLGARQRAQDRAAQSDLRNGLTAEKTFYTDGESFTAVTASMTAIEPSLTWNVSNDKGPMVTVDAAFNQVCLERSRSRARSSQSRTSPPTRAFRRRPAPTTTRVHAPPR